MDPNATTIERIMSYMERDEEHKARALATLADYLEECYQWDVCFD